MRPVIILFAKAPVPGRVKTRLADRLGEVEAASLHQAFVWDTLETLHSLADLADVELHTDTPTDAWSAAGVSRALQCEGDLGLRMLHALDRALDAGRPQAMIVGGDAPTLPAAHLRGILGSAADVVLGGCEDGGYYAIACRRTAPRMFDGVEWSGAGALEATARAVRQCNLTVEIAPAWFDVDTPEDLDRLLRSGWKPRGTM